MNTTVNEITQERALKASIKFLERQGYEILDSNPDLKNTDLVAQINNTVCFIEVSCREGAEVGFLESTSSRSEAERDAALWLTDHDKVDVRVRFDKISLLVLSPTRAFLRHHTNALSSEA